MEERGKDLEPKISVLYVVAACGLAKRLVGRQKGSTGRS